MEKREYTTALSITLCVCVCVFPRISGSVFRKTVGPNSTKLGRQVGPWHECVEYHFELAPPTTTATGRGEKMALFVPTPGHFEEE
jgi:hypothetical protein